MASPPSLYGLILAGGASKRMQADKAALEYQGRQQLHRAFELASRFCEKTFASVRPDQLDDPLRGSFPTIADRRSDLGPIAGIEAAQIAHPEVAWLVLACDLPFLQSATLEHLIQHRNPGRLATAYRSTHDGLPEPLCAIWEPSSRDAVQAWIAAGKQCPRKLLINSDTQLLDQPDVHALDNVNTPDEYSAASAVIGDRGQGTGDSGRTADGGQRTVKSNASLATASSLQPEASATASLAPASSLQPPAPIKTLRLQYFALFREQAGRGEETLETAADTPASLYAELQARHPFHLRKEQLRVAINTEFCDWQTKLRHGDTVVFIPPVAGG